MLIKKIQLKNGYKRFHNLTIDLGENPKKIVALIGPNGCGKSSVLDGMLFLHNAHGQIGDKGSRDFMYHSMTQAPSFNHQNIIIDFVDGSYQEVLQTKQEEGKDRTIFSFRSPYRYNSALKITNSSSVPEIRLNNFGASTSSDIDDKMEQNYRRLYAKFHNRLRVNGKNYEDTIAEIIGELNSSIKFCLDLELVNIGVIEDNKGTLYFKKDDTDNEFEFNVLSSGEKEVVDILLDLYLRQEEYIDTIFLIDEPELHINTSIQKKLLIEINKLIGDNCQIWVATHSIGLLRALQEDFKDISQIIQFKDDNYASEEKILVPIDKNWQNWKEIFRVAIDDLTELVSPRQIIYCEGKDVASNTGQENGLDANVYNKIFSEKYHDVMFVSSGGNTELDQRSEIAIKILSKVFSDLDILVLKDMDMASGATVTEDMRSRYLRLNPENHRILTRWEIENFLFDKEILKKYCADSGLDFNEVEYDKFVTDIINQDVKKEFSQIKSFCGITTNISKEKFKIDLAGHITNEMDIYKELEKCIFKIDD